MSLFKKNTVTLFICLSLLANQMPVAKASAYQSAQRVAGLLEPYREAEVTGGIQAVTKKVLAELKAEGLDHSETANRIERKAILRRVLKIAFITSLALTSVGGLMGGGMYFAGVLKTGTWALTAFLDAIYMIWGTGLAAVSAALGVPVSGLLKFLHIENFKTLREALFEDVFPGTSLVSLKRLNSRAVFLQFKDENESFPILYITKHVKLTNKQIHKALSELGVDGPKSFERFSDGHLVELVDSLNEVELEPGNWLLIER